MTQTFATTVRTPGASGLPNNTVVGNISGTINLTAAAITVSDLLDSVFGKTQGTLFFRGVSGWTALPPGKKNANLASGGPGQDPFWK